MKELFDRLSIKISRKVTHTYSTSFSLGIRMLHRDFRDAIYAIYGFVRFADEIVDSFHDHDKEDLLHDFREQTFRAIKQKISLNPVLNTFQLAVNKYEIDHQLIEQFLHSMKMDLSPQEYTREKYEEYILGSAQVVGLMSLKVFCHSEPGLYDQLTPSAKRLGSAFQKVNFLRDLKADIDTLGRSYFPNWQEGNFNDTIKQDIEDEILEDFKAAREGIRRLPPKAKFGVYAAYVYYKALFMRIQRIDPQILINKRVRIPNGLKIILLFFAKLNVKLRRI